MNKKIVLLLIFFKLNSFGQSPDSSTYFFFQGQKHIESLKYFREFYKNGILKSEGWLVKEKPLGKSKISIALISDRGSEFALGVWKTYYKNGKILTVDSFGINDTVVKRFYFYKKNGCLDRIVTMKPLVTPYRSNDRFLGAVSNYQWMHKLIYNCEGLEFDVYFSSKEKPMGIWKYYKNGKLIKIEEYYEHGKKIKQTKYDS